MNQRERIINLARENNGYLTSEAADQHNIPRGSIKYLVSQNEIVKFARGVYGLPNVFEDEYFIAQYQFRKGIFCLESALFLLDLVDTTPARLTMAFPQTYNLSRPKTLGIFSKSFREPAYSLGIIEITSPGGNMIRTYNHEKTLCDILRPSRKVDVQLISEAFKNYAASEGRNIPQLSRYAKQLKVDEKVRAYLEVLL